MPPDNTSFWIFSAVCPRLNLPHKSKISFSSVAFLTMSILLINSAFVGAMDAPSLPETIPVTFTGNSSATLTPLS